MLKLSYGVIAIGYADDTNLLAPGRDTARCCESLLAAWEICLQWATRRGMIFSPSKSELLHFVRSHKPPTITLRLDADTLLEPVESARFLGIWLDRKLLFYAHTDQVLRKLKTQRYALTRLTAKT